MIWLEEEDIEDIEVIVTDIIITITILEEIVIMGLVYIIVDFMAEDIIIIVEGLAQGDTMALAEMVLLSSNIVLTQLLTM